MQDHRIRLSDSDIDLITASLRARAAMAGAVRRYELLRLAERLAEGGRGNPTWRLGNGQRRAPQVDPRRG